MIVDKKQISLAIVDDHNLFRKGLIKLIKLADADNSYTIIFEAENGLDLQEKLSKNNIPDIILMDIEMPDMDGYECVEWLSKNYPSVHVLVVSMFEKEEAVIRMLKLGVKGYLSKDIEVEDVHTALESIASDELYFAGFVTGIMQKNIQKEGLSSLSDKYFSTQGGRIELSENELRFLKFACTEMTYEQIADQMCLSPKTIDGYRAALFSKFKLKNRVGLVLYAIKNGLVKI